MREFKVLAANIGGVGGRVYYNGQIVSEDNLHPTTIEPFLRNKFIEEVHGVSSQEEFVFSATHKPIVFNAASHSNGVFQSVADALRLEIENDKSLLGCVIVVGYNVAPYDAVRKKFPNSKIIPYQLEQLCSIGNMWWNHAGLSKEVKQWLTSCDEIWDYSIENIQFLRTQSLIKAKVK